MKRYSDMEFLRLSKGQKFLYKLTSFFAAIPRAIGRLFLAIGRFFKNIGVGIAKELADIVSTFVKGDWSNRSSYSKQVESTSTNGMAYDALICYNLTPYVLAVSGLVENLYGTDYIDLSAPWWPSAYLGDVCAAALEISSL